MGELELSGNSLFGLVWYLLVRLGDGNIRTHWEFFIWVSIVFASQVRRWEN